MPRRRTVRTCQHGPKANSGGLSALTQQAHAALITSNSNASGHEAGSQMPVEIPPHNPSSILHNFSLIPTVKRKATRLEFIKVCGAPTEH